MIPEAQKLYDDRRTSRMVITVTDLWRAGRHCGPGTRAWFRKHFAPHGKAEHEIFMRYGMPARRFLAHGDGLSVQVVECKLRRLDG